MQEKEKSGIKKTKTMKILYDRSSVIYGAIPKNIIKS